MTGVDVHYGAHNSRQLIPDRAGTHASIIEHLLGRHGTLYTELLDLVAGRPDLGEPLASAPEYLKVEAY